jgi:hypothetical protein
VVELFLGHLFELFDELDNVIVLILACVVGVECVFLSCLAHHLPALIYGFSGKKNIKVFF